MATTIPADVAILGHPDFANVEHSTKWVEERLDLTRLAAAPVATAEGGGEGDEPPLVQRRTTVEVNGKRFDVSLWVPDVAAAASSTSGGRRAVVRNLRRSPGHGPAAAAGSGDVTVPMQGTIVKVLVEVGQHVEAGQAVVVLEAMKMENQISAEREGTIKEIKVAAGDTVGGGDVVAVIE